MNKLVVLFQKAIMLFFLFVAISLVTYVPEDEVNKANITPGDQLIIDLFK